MKFRVFRVSVVNKGVLAESISGGFVKNCVQALGALGKLAVGEAYGEFNLQQGRNLLNRCGLLNFGDIRAAPASKGQRWRTAAEALM